MKKGETVQETIIVTCTARDGKDSKAFSGSTVRYNFAGGKYGTMKAYDGQRHHMPSNSAKAFRKKEKEKIAKNRFLEAQQLGISDVQGKFGIKYNAAINDMIVYTKGLGYKK